VDQTAQARDLLTVSLEVLHSREECGIQQLNQAEELAAVELWSVPAFMDSVLGRDLADVCVA
jgi:hypothetical protein